MTIKAQRESENKVPAAKQSAAAAMQSLVDAPPITPRRRRTSGTRRWAKRVLALILLIGVVDAIWWYWAPIKEFVSGGGTPKGSGNLDTLQTYTVKRGPLRITMIEEGKLRAVKNYAVTLGVSGKITFLAEAGAKVKKGDLLATLDKKPYEDTRARLQLDLEAAKSALAVAEQAVPISKSNGEAAVAAAKSKLDDAILALKTYTTLDVPKKLNDMETQINDTRTKLADAQKKRADAQSQLDEKMLDDDADKKNLAQAVELQKQSVASLIRSQRTLEDQRKLFRAYNYPQDMKTKQQALKNAELDVNKANVNAKSELLQKEAEVRRQQLLIERYQGDMKRYDEFIAKCSAFAPVDGLVFYGSPEQNRYGDINDRIRIGADWYSDGAIMTIPDLSSFQVDVPVAEVYRGRVTTGMQATVTVEAVPGLIIDGSLLSLASVARNRIPWDQSSPQVFDAALSLSKADERMVAGMTVKVEVVTASLENVMFAPIESIFNEEGKTAAFIWTQGEGGGHWEKRPVLTGQANDHFVELKEGVSENDKLALARPSGFVVPPNYREQVDAMFPAMAPPNRSMSRPAASGPATQGAPMSAPSDGPVPPGSQPAAGGHGATLPQSVVPQAAVPLNPPVENRSAMPSSQQIVVPQTVPAVLPAATQAK